MHDLEVIICQVGIALRHLRVKAGYKSYEQFAFENKMSRIQYWKMENGNNFTIKSLINVLNIHNVELTVFFDSLKTIRPKKTKDSIRLIEIITYSGLDKHKFSERLGYKNSIVISHVLLGGRQISTPFAKKIKESFPAINLNWILSGKGKFLNITDQLH